MNTISFRRNGDVNLHPISKKDFDSFRGAIIKHNGSYVLAKGEATGSIHKITVMDPIKMIIKQNKLKETMIAVLQQAEITHTYDHERLYTPEIMYYRQVQEREVDHFANSITKKVID